MHVWMSTLVDLAVRKLAWEGWFEDPSKLEVLNVIYAYAVLGRPVARKNQLLTCQHTWEEVEQAGLVQLCPVGECSLGKTTDCCDEQQRSPDSQCVLHYISICLSSLCLRSKNQY